MSALLLLQMVAYWPVWQWYIARVSDGSDEPWGVVALLTALWICVGERRNAGTLTRLHHQAMIALLILYILTYAFVPPLVRAIIAMTSVAVWCSAYRKRPYLDTALFGVLVLSLPIIASLQFFLGFPLRLVSAWCAGVILRMLGVLVTVQGTVFQWRGDMIAVDAPCSGIKMLWTGLFVTFTLAALYRLNVRRTWFAYASASVLVFLGNVSRIVILFFSESHLLAAPRYFHSGVGVLSFAVVLSLSALIVRRLAYANAHTS